MLGGPMRLLLEDPSGAPLQPRHPQVDRGEQQRGIAESAERDQRGDQAPPQRILADV